MLNVRKITDGAYYTLEMYHWHGPLLQGSLLPFNKSGATFQRVWTG